MDAVDAADFELQFNYRVRVKGAEIYEVSKSFQAA